jgi:hypothetical protein
VHSIWLTLAAHPAVQAECVDLGHGRADHQHDLWPDQRSPGRRRNGLDHDSAVSCDNVTTVRLSLVGDTIGLLFDDQEPALHPF